MKKAKALPSFSERVYAKLKAGTPKAEGATYEISRSSERILSEIKYVLTTGIRVFDDLMGGFPFGRICEMYGLESCGKTAMALRAAIRAQHHKICKITHTGQTIEYTPINPDEVEVTVLYIDNEQSVDNDQKLTVDGLEADIHISRADTVDLLFKMVDLVIQAKKDRVKELEELGIEREQFVVIIVDTITATCSRQELEQEWGKEDYARQPQQISAGFRQIVRDVNRHNVCMICTNQTRENIGYNSGNKGRKVPSPTFEEYTTFGGRALRFYASHRIFLQQTSARYKLVPGSQFGVGCVIAFRSIKNRIRKPLIEGRMVLLYDEEKGGFNEVFSILESLIFLGFAEVENKEKGTHFVFKFLSNKIPTTTFGEALSTSLAEDDEKPRARRGARKDPFIETRSEWPSFYEAHKADFELLWSAAVVYAFTSEGLGADPAQIDPEVVDVSEVETLSEE